VGNIGGPMAERLMRSGFDLCVCDRSDAARSHFAKIGARIADRPADCAQEEMVVFMVANEAQLEEAALGADGLAAGVDPAAPPLVAIMSTIMPEAARAIAAKLESRNLRVVDAPVSGGAVRAAKGQLSIMIGG